MPLAEVNLGATINEDSYILPDHTTYWGSDAAGDLDLYRATWTGSNFRVPERVIGIDAPDNSLKASPVDTLRAKQEKRVAFLAEVQFTLGEL